MKKILLLSILFLSLLAFNAHATIWYVDVNTAQVGNDGSMANPWTELDQITGTSPDDVIRVLAGTYSTTLTVPAGVTVYFGYDGQAIIDGNDSLSNGIFIRDKSSVHLFGYKSNYSIVKNCTGHGVLIDEYSGNRSDIVVRYIDSTLNGGAGIKVNQAGEGYNLTDIDVSYNKVTYNDQSGIDAQYYDNNNSVSIHDNVIEHNNQSGASFQGISISGRFAKYPASPFPTDPGTLVQSSGNVYYFSYAKHATVGEAYVWTGDDTSADNRVLTETASACADNPNTLSNDQWCFDAAANRVYFNIGQDPPTTNIAVITGHSGKATVYNNTIRYNKSLSTGGGDGSGIYFDNGTENCVGYNNTIAFNEGCGFVTANSVDNTFYNNVLNGNGTDLSQYSAGIKLRRHSTGFTAWANTIYNQGSSGDCLLLLGYNGGTVSFVNNICDTIPGDGIAEDESGYTETDDYNQYINIGGTVGGDGGHDVTSLNSYVDPSNGDFRIKHGSGAENNGLYSASYPYDKDNNLRSDPPDIGAYEIPKSMTEELLLLILS